MDKIPVEFMIVVMKINNMAYLQKYDSAASYQIYEFWFNVSNNL